MKLFSTAIAFAAAATFIAVTTFTHDAFAAKKERRFPHGCREMGYGYKDGLLILKPVPNDSLKPKTPQTAANGEQQKSAEPVEVPIQTHYLIHNLSGQSIYLKTKKLKKSYGKICNHGYPFCEFLRLAYLVKLEITSIKTKD